MSELDHGYPPKSTGGSDGGPTETGPVPFFPPASGAAPGPPPGIPLSAPIPTGPMPAAPAQTHHSGWHSPTTGEHVSPASIPAQGPAPVSEPPAESPLAPSEPPTPERPSRESGAVVKGRIKVEDEVVEKIAALAALEVRGIADLGGDPDRPVERDRMGSARHRDHRGVKAKVQDNEVSLDVTVVVEYGSIVMEVAKAVKSNVARVTSRMLGMRVTSVNITVADVHIPDEDGGNAHMATRAATAEPADPA